MSDDLFMLLCMAITVIIILLLFPILGQGFVYLLSH